MNRKAKELTLALAALAVLLLLPAAVKADPIVITLDDARTVASGFTVTFQGTLANTGPGNRYVNAVGFTFSGGFADFTFDPSDFFAAATASFIFVCQSLGTPIFQTNLNLAYPCDSKNSIRISYSLSFSKL